MMANLYSDTNTCLQKEYYKLNNHKLQITDNYYFGLFLRWKVGKITGKENVQLGDNKRNQAIKNHWSLVQKQR